MRRACSFLFAPDEVLAFSTPSLTPLPVEFRGDIHKPNDLSGVAAVGDLLVIVSDEVKKPTVVQVLKKDGAGYVVFKDVPLTAAGKEEVDLEAIAAAGDMVYVTGSHSWARKIENGVIEEPKRKESREQVFRFKLNHDGTAGAVDGPISLTPVILSHPVLKAFFGVASKENGVDIEGLAVKDNRLYFGFRSPVLRHGFVPVVSCTWADPVGTAKTMYVKLGGRGIRDIEAVDGGFLVLAGPTGDGDGSFRVYFWDGTDQLPSGENGSQAQELGEFPDMGAGHPEALTVLKAEGNTYEMLLLCDGLPNGGPTLWKMTRP